MTRVELPPNRPICPGCSRPVGYWCSSREPRVFSGWKGYTAAYFCTLRCAARYAAYMFKQHGTRLEVKK